MSLYKVAWRHSLALDFQNELKWANACNHTKRLLANSKTNCETNDRRGPAVFRNDEGAPYSKKFHRFRE